MRAIYKYTFTNGDNYGEVPLVGEIVDMELPYGARILSFDFQDGQAVLWAMVDPTTKTMQTRRMVLLFTGTEMPDIIGNATFIGTTTVNGLVWHLLEVVRSD